VRLVGDRREGRICGGIPIRLGTGCPQSKHSNSGSELRARTRSSSTRVALLGTASGPSAFAWSSAAHGLVLRKTGLAVHCSASSCAGRRRWSRRSLAEVSFGGPPGRQPSPSRPDTRAVRPNCLERPIHSPTRGSLGYRRRACASYHVPVHPRHSYKTLPDRSRSAARCSDRDVAAGCGRRKTLFLAWLVL